MKNLKFVLKLIIGVLILLNLFLIVFGVTRGNVINFVKENNLAISEAEFEVEKNKPTWTSGRYEINHDLTKVMVYDGTIDYLFDRYSMRIY